MKEVTHRQYIIRRWYVLRDEDNNIVAEFETRKKAMKGWDDYPGTELMAACAEEIDANGNVNPPVVAPNMAAAMRKLLSILP